MDALNAAWAAWVKRTVEGRYSRTRSVPKWHCRGRPCGSFVRRDKSRSWSINQDPLAGGKPPFGAHVLLTTRRIGPDGGCCVYLHTPDPQGF